MSRSGKTTARKPRLGKGLYWRGPVIWCRFKVAGREYRVSCHTSTESVAEKRRKAERDAVIAQAVYGEVGPKSWSEAVLEWTNNPPDVSEKTLKRYASSLLQVAPFLSHLSVQEITSAALKDLVAQRRRVATNRTVQRDLTAVSSVLDVAEDLGWVEENVAHTFNRKKIRSARHKIVLPSADDIREVIAAAPGRLAELALFAWETGIRQDEGVQLQRRDADEKRAQATIYYGAKRDKVRTVDLSPVAVAVVQRQPKRLRCPYLFWSDTSDDGTMRNVSSRFAAVVRRVARKAAQEGREFRSFRFHDLRHHFAVYYLKDERGSIYDLKLSLGHDRLETTEMYLAYLTPEEARRAKEAGGTKSGTPTTVRHDAAASASPAAASAEG